MGEGLAKGAWESLRGSEATKTGLLENLEETILMVEGISSDIVSDILTNIIREPLIHYTSDAATYYGIRLESDVASGPLSLASHNGVKSKEKARLSSRIEGPAEGAR